MKQKIRFLTALLALAAHPSALAVPGKILLMNDEWTLSDSGYSQPGAQPGQFALNIADWISGSSGSFLAYSSNFGLNGSSLASTLTSAGYSYTVDMSNPFTLPNISGYNAVFLAGDAVDNAVLIDYVNGGGSVVLMGGTGLGGAIAEAAQWNTFLNAFGLGFAPAYNGVLGVIEINNAHPIFSGVTGLYQNNGNDTVDLSASDPNAQVLVSLNGNGLYAVYEQLSDVPETGGQLLQIGLGSLVLLSAGFRARFKK